MKYFKPIYPFMIVKNENIKECLFTTFFNGVLYNSSKIVKYFI